METFFDNSSYFQRFLSIFWIFRHLIVTTKLLTSAYNRWLLSVFSRSTYPINISFNNCKEGGGQFEKISEKTTLKSPGLLGLILMGFTDLFYKEI